MPMLDLFDQKDETDFFCLNYQAFNLNFLVEKSSSSIKVFASFLNFLRIIVGMDVSKIT